MSTRVVLRWVSTVVCAGAVVTVAAGAHGSAIGERTAGPGHAQAKTQKDMVSIDKLRPLAEKMASRF
jgi:hypothetical protein